jgi:hypothetical protein
MITLNFFIMGVIGLFVYRCQNTVYISMSFCANEFDEQHATESVVFGRA